MNLIFFISNILWIDHFVNVGVTVSLPWMHLFALVLSRNQYCKQVNWEVSRECYRLLGKKKKPVKWSNTDKDKYKAAIECDRRLLIVLSKSLLQKAEHIVEEYFFISCMLQAILMRSHVIVLAVLLNMKLVNRLDVIDHIINSIN